MDEKRKNIRNRSELASGVPSDKFIGLSIKVSDTDFEKIVTEKKKLQQSSNFGHIYIKKQMPRENVKAANKLRNQAQTFNNGGDENGKVTYRGKTYDLNDGKFIETNLNIRFKRNEA